MKKFLVIWEVEQVVDARYEEEAVEIFCENNHVDEKLRKNGDKDYLTVVDQKSGWVTEFQVLWDEEFDELYIVEGTAESFMNDAIMCADAIKYSKEKPKFKVQHKYFKDEFIEAFSAYDAAEKFCSKHGFVKGWYAYAEDIPITVIDGLHAIAVYRIKYSDEKTPILYPPFELEYQNYEERKQFPREYWNNWGIPDDKN